MKINEKMLEDWICEHLEETFWPGAVLIGRQISLPHGILDLLVFIERTVVVELKARRLKEKDIGQVLRYAYDVRLFLQELASRVELFDGKKPLTFSEQIYSDLWSTLHGFEMGIELAVLPTLIGTGINDSTMAAACSAGVHVMIWDYDPETGNFIFNPAEPVGLPDHVSLEPWVIELSNKISGLCEDDTETIFANKVAQLFGAEKWAAGVPYTLPFVTGVHT